MPHSTAKKAALRWVPGDGPVAMHLLCAGTVNRSWRVARAGRTYSMRMADVSATPRNLGLDREWECRVMAGAAAAGLAPNIVRCDPAQGLLVAEWVHGRAWTAEEIVRPAAVEAMAALLRGAHAIPIPQPARVMSPTAWSAHYAHALEKPVAPAAQSRLLRLADIAAPEPVLCHSDLHRQNVLVETRRVVLLDWEYAHVADPFWDLAGWIANNDWDRGLGALLLASYLQRPMQSDEAARLELLLWLYDYVCLQWSELYLKQRPAAAGSLDANDKIAVRARRLAARLGASG